MRRYALLLCIFTAGVNAAEPLEEVVVTAPFQKSAADTALPIGVLSEEELRKQVANSLGETLQNQLGVHSASFGPGVGQPVIRGQSGKRVQVLQNSVAVSDAANISPDHANGIEPLLADRIEVVRGPATLLFGSGAIGGVVNVIDQRVPTKLFQQADIVLEQSHQSVSNEHKSLIGITGSLGNFSLHGDYFYRGNQDVEINGYAIDEAAVRAQDASQTPMINKPASSNSKNYIHNSDGDGEGGTLGISWIGDRGFIGVSVNQLRSNYGLPSTQLDDPAASSAPVDIHDVRIALDQTRVDLKSHVGFDQGWFRDVDFNLGYTDYQHEELEIDSMGAKEVGTQFLNQGVEARLTASHRVIENPETNSQWEGVWGLQASSTDFSALGAEAFIPKTAIAATSVFGVERFTQGRFTTEFGLRLERNSLDPISGCSREGIASSGSISVIYDLTSSTNLLMSYAHSERNPTVEELYSNRQSNSCAALATSQLVTHEATNLVEIGDPDLGQERSSNYEIGFRKYDGKGTAEFSAYYNKIADYIYLQLSNTQLDDATVANYQGRDATFVGFEAAYEFPLIETRTASLNVRLASDLVRASFDQGGDVPRIPPARVSLGLNWGSEDWTLELNSQRVFSQRRTAEEEDATGGYTLVSLYADRHLPVAAGGEFVFFARATNLLDEEVRNHVSLLKNYAPEAGRGIRVGVRYRY